MTFGVVASSHPAIASPFYHGTYSGDTTTSQSISMNGSPQIVAVAAGNTTWTGGDCYATSALAFRNRFGLTLRDDGDHVNSFSVASDGTSATVVDGTRLNSSGTWPTVEWTPGSVVSGSYVGDGASSKAVSLSGNVELIFVVGSPSGGDVQGFALKNRAGLRYYASTVPVAASSQLSLNSSGSTLTVSGTGTLGLNRSGTTYYYMGVSDSPRVDTSYSGNGTQPRDISLSSACHFVVVLGASVNHTSWVVRDSDNDGRSIGGARLTTTDSGTVLTGLDDTGDTLTVAGISSTAGANYSGETYYVVGW